MPTGVWSPGSEPPASLRQTSPERGKNTERDSGIAPIWTPSSAGASPVLQRKEFRPVSFESPIVSHKNKPQAQVTYFLYINKLYFEIKYKKLKMQEKNLKTKKM